MNSLVRDSIIPLVPLAIVANDVALKQPIKTTRLFNLWKSSASNSPFCLLETL